MKQGLFEVFGEGELGLKADDLNRGNEIVTNLGMKIPEGIVIATGVFEQLLKTFNLNEQTTSEEFEKIECPNFLLSINDTVLDKLGIKTPYFIRSSALSEQGGTGIYKSVPFTPSGNRIEDLQRLWECEIQIYASEFTPDARLWRERNNSPIGMAILIQLVAGFDFEGYFLPPLSGVAYTSYQGMPTVRVVVGLGSKAVNGEGVIYNTPPEHFLSLQRSVWDQETADAITKNGIEETDHQYPEIYSEIKAGFEAFNRLFAILAELDKQGSFYMEWAIYRGIIYILQFARYNDHLLGDGSFDSKEYLHLLEGKDVLHSGRASCKSLVFVYKWDRLNADLLEELNSTTKDYLLIITQEALSKLADLTKDDRGQRNVRLGYRHFSNALAVVEWQIFISPENRKLLYILGKPVADHTEDRGASHFAQLCNRANVLFIGAEFSFNLVYRITGGMDYGGEDSRIRIWDTDAEVLADAKKKEGHVYISKKVRHHKYSISQINEWSDILRQIANQLMNQGNEELAGHFYMVHYGIGKDNDSADFDPYEIDETIVAECGGKDKFAEILPIVNKEGSNFDQWSEALSNYLAELCYHLIRQN
jgi:hypothetical protein